MDGDREKLEAPAAVEDKEDCAMRPANKATDTWEGLSGAGCGELLRYAIDRLAIDSMLSPRDRARLASATVVLGDIREDLERDSGRKAQSRKSAGRGRL